jgi:Glycosyltransferase family 87
LEKKSEKNNYLRVALGVCIFFIALHTLLFVLVRNNLPAANDVLLYFRYANRMLSGEIPYRDFLVEYPPFALPFLLLPGIVALIFGDLSFGTYQALFLIQNGLLLIITLWLIYKLLLKLRPASEWQAIAGLLAAYTIGSIILCIFLYQRYDIGAAFLTFGAVYLFLHNRPGWAGGVLALATACKLFPALFLPLFLLYYWYHDLSRLRTIGRHVAAFAVTGLLTTLPFFLLSPSGFLKFLSYHGDRGIEVETIFAGIIVFAHYLDFVPALVMIEASSVGLASPWSRPLATVSTLLTLVGVAILYLYFWRSQSRATSYELRATKQEADPIPNHPSSFILHPSKTASFIIHASSLLTLWFIVANKVISPQYLVWLLPFVPLWKSGWARLLFLAALPLSTLPFPFLIDWLFRLDPLPYILLLIRNGLLVAVFVLLLGSLKPRPA